MDYFPKLWETPFPTISGTRPGSSNALPEGWEQLEYDEFLERRRKHIAIVIRTAFDKLRTGTAAVPALSSRPTLSGPTVAELIAGEESFEVEFKQSGVGHHLQSGKPQSPSDNVVKTVAAFLNSSTVPASTWRTATTLFGTRSGESAAIPPCLLWTP